MSMSKMECAVSAAWDDVTLDGTNQGIAEALNAGSQAMDLLLKLYFYAEQQKLSMSVMFKDDIEKLLKEWT